MFFRPRLWVNCLFMTRFSPEPCLILMTTNTDREYNPHRSPHVILSSSLKIVSKYYSNHQTEKRFTYPWSWHGSTLTYALLLELAPELRNDWALAPRWFHTQVSPSLPSQAFWECLSSTDCDKLTTSSILVICFQYFSDLRYLFTSLLFFFQFSHFQTHSDSSHGLLSTNTLM